MERQDFIKLLQSKDETIVQFKSMISSFEKLLEADAIERNNLLDQIAKLTAEVAKLNDYNQHHNKFSFGKKSLKSGSKPDNKPSREEEKMTLMEHLVLCPRNLSMIRPHFGGMMKTELNYMVNGWEKLLNYRHDGRYDIDNLEAERKIRPLTIGRKNTLFFGSEEGVEVATTYYTLIETAKLNNLSPMDYLTHVFRQLMDGNKDYENLLPGKLALQTI